MFHRLLAFWLLWVFCTVAAPMAAAQTDIAAERAQDLAFFERQYLARDRAFTDDARPRALALLRALQAEAGTLSAPQFNLRIARITALADNAHSLTFFGPGVGRGRLPFKLAWMSDDELLILRSLEPHQDLAGGIITAIDGMPTARAASMVKAVYGGPDTRRLIMAGVLAEGGGLLHEVGVAKQSDRLLLTIRLPDGRVIDRDVQNIPSMTGVGAWPNRYWSADPLEGDPRAWIPAVDQGRQPLYLRDPDTPFRIESLPDLNALYVQLRTNENERGQMNAFHRALEARLQRERPGALIVDQRFNVGGNLDANRDFMQRLPSRLPPGAKIFLIVGRYTFSAGLQAAAYLKEAGGDRVIVVGEALGDRPRYWSEGERVCLPNSGVCVRYTELVRDFERGCRGERHCAAGPVVGGLVPDIRAPMTAAAYLAGRDPAMEAITAALGR
ncbi:MAG TPA: hypothetical protein VFF48_08030, partial [Brevundimonas sp.]|nr:hypothetical protein [Brevundimonas sp.]